MLEKMFIPVATLLVPWMVFCAGYFDNWHKYFRGIHNTIGREIFLWLAVTCLLFISVDLILLLTVALGLSS